LHELIIKYVVVVILGREIGNVMYQGVVPDVVTLTINGNVPFKCAFKDGVGWLVRSVGFYDQKKPQRVGSCEPS
jgi:hypothetical protein